MIGSHAVNQLGGASDDVNNLSLQDRSQTDLLRRNWRFQYAIFSRPNFKNDRSIAVNSQAHPTQKLAGVARSVYMGNFWYGGDFVTTVLCKSCRVPPSVAPWYAKIPPAPTRMIGHCHFYQNQERRSGLTRQQQAAQERAGRLSSGIAGTQGTG